MAVTKRVRYEVLRRDGHKCRYCGATALDGPLTVDHVIPVSLGGSDDPSNLVAACRPCNAGKTSTAPDGPVVSDVQEKALEWASAIRMAAEERRADRAGRELIEQDFRESWDAWTYGNSERTVPLPDNWERSVHQFLEAGLNGNDLDDLIAVAMRCKTTKDVWRYFCGCCWTRIRQAQDRAKEIIGDAAIGASDFTCTCCGNAVDRKEFEEDPSDEIQCASCNASICDAYDHGWRNGYDVGAADERRALLAIPVEEAASAT